VARSSRTLCIYCGARAGSTEHIIATRFLDLLRQDPRGLMLPIPLTITLPGGVVRRISGKKNKRGKYTLEYTTRVCGRCNSGWMNDIDTNAYPYLKEMIQGRAVSLDRQAQTAVASWIAKVVVTARSSPHDRSWIDPGWTDQLYQRRLPPVDWYVWIEKYVGGAPLFFQQEDVSVVTPAVSPAVDQRRTIRGQGVAATLVLGYLGVQILGISEVKLLNSDPQPLTRIWPVVSEAVHWPGMTHIDDSHLALLAERLTAPKSRED
jgi:hypothetical protein